MLVKTIKSTIILVLFGTGLIAGLFFYPVFYLLWALYNRKNINLWLSLSTALLSMIISYLHYRILSGYLIINWLDPTTNPLFLYGVFLTFPFIITRSGLKNPQRISYKNLAIVLYGFQLILFLSPIATLHFLLPSGAYTVTFFLAEALIILWVSLVTYLFVKYPEDIFIKNLYGYLSNLRSDIRASGRTNKK